MTDSSFEGAGPAVVAIGGGHGLAQTLRAVRRYAGSVTAVVSVADDGGSSGRLREQLGIPAPGDVRKCMGALLPNGSLLGAALEHRFSGGDLAGHAFGNLLIAALAGSAGDFVEGVAEACRLLNTVGAVLPATREPVVLRARGPGEEVQGQVRIQEQGGIMALDVLPPDAEAPKAAAEALAKADQIVIGPGSLYTSLLAALVVPGIRAALSASSVPLRQRVYVANLREQVPETMGYDVAAHVRALSRHGVAVGTVVADSRALPLGDVTSEQEHVAVCTAAVADERLVLHEPRLLGQALEQVWRST